MMDEGEDYPVLFILVYIFRILISLILAVHVKTSFKGNFLCTG